MAASLLFQRQQSPCKKAARPVSIAPGPRGRGREGLPQLSPSPHQSRQTDRPKTSVQPKRRGQNAAHAESRGASGR